MPISTSRVVGPRRVPVELQMFGDDGQRLQRAARRSTPTSSACGFAPEQVAQRRAHRIGLREAGAGQRRVRMIALHPSGEVVDRLAMPRDEVAALPLGVLGVSWAPRFNPLWRESNGFPRLSGVHATSAAPHPFEPIPRASGDQSEWSSSCVSSSPPRCSPAPLATPAFAQEANPTFTGPRIEGTLGYDHVGAGSSVSNNNGRDDQKIDGLLYGGGIGYDFAAGGVVLGIEGEITGSTAKSEQQAYTSTFGFGRVTAGRDLYVGARAGILATPSTMVYVKGGYTNAKLNVLAGNTTTTTDTSFKLDGWRVGAGAERALSEQQLRQARIPLFEL